MSWGAAVWALIFLLAGLLFAYELISQKRYRLRLAVILLPIVASLWIYGSAWLRTHHLRNLALACVTGDTVEMESRFASRVTVGVKDYERGPKLFSIYRTTSQKKEDIEALHFHPGFVIPDPFHVYVAISGDTDPGTGRYGMFRLALTPSGWKVDQELHGNLWWGPRIRSLPGW